MKAAAARRVAEAKAIAAVGKLIPDDPTPVRDPFAMLARLAGEADAFRSALALKVNELSKMQLADPESAGKLAAHLASYERALDRTARISESLAKLNLEGRLVAVEEQTAAVVFTVLEKALSAAVTDAGQRAQVRTLVAAGFREIGAAS